MLLMKFCKSLMFRFILIKYADRGLVKNGNVSKLFDHLYLTISGSMTVFFLGFIFVNHFDSRLIPIAVNICTGENSAIDADSLRLPIVSCGIGITIITTTLLLFLSAKRFVKSKSKSGKTPAIYGRYQRNLVTFSQTIFLNTAIITLLLIQVLLMFQFGGSKAEMKTGFL